MIRKVLLITLLGVCSGFFEPGSKFSSWRKGIHHFAQQAANSAKKLPHLETEAGGSQRNLLDKLRAALLIKGQPLGDFSPNALLPFFGLKKTSKSSRQQRGKGGRVSLQSYSIANCSEQAGDEPIFLVQDLTISPDPLSIPGDLTFAFKVNVKQDIDNISVAVDFRKKEDSTYVKIPCIGEFGSCTYSVCEMLQQVASCPEQLQKDKIPCYCPFRKGQYKEPGITAEIDSDVFPSGDYKATANMTAAKIGFIGCYVIRFSIVD